MTRVAIEHASRKLHGVVFPGVFSPRSDTVLLATAAMREPVPASGGLLELCAGPGLAGIAIARHTRATLTTVDVSRRAVLNVHVNARLNGVHVRARRGDLFAAVRDERFNLIIANPPYVPGPAPPSHGPARAWDAGTDGRAILDRICHEASAHLHVGGAVLLVHSEVCGQDVTLDALARHGLDTDVVERARGPLGPLLRSRRSQLETCGLLRPGQQTEDVLVIRGRLNRTATAARSAALSPCHAGGPTRSRQSRA